MQRMKMWHDISVGKKYDNMEIPVNLTDYEQYDSLTAFVFLREKDIEQKFEECKQYQYEVCAVHPDKSNEHYHIHLTYIMPLDVLIEWLKTTEYRIVSINKNNSKKANYNNNIQKMPSGTELGKK